MKYAINQWYRCKTGLKPVSYDVQTAVGTKRFVEEATIPRFSAYYMRYCVNMRMPTPTKQILTADQYKSQWIETCLTQLYLQSIDDIPKSADIRAMAKTLYAQYGEHECVEPNTAIALSLGTHADNWTKEVAKQLRSRAGEEDYKAVAGIGGTTPEAQAQYLYEHFSDQAPVSAINSYFGLVDRLKDSKVTKGAVMAIKLPEFVKHKTEISEVTLESETVSYKGDIVVLQYKDNEKLIYNALEEWRLLAQDEGIPQNVYAVDTDLHGINNVSYLDDIRTLCNVYPVALSPTTVELRFEVRDLS